MLQALCNEGVSSHRHQELQGRTMSCSLCLTPFLSCLPVICILQVFRNEGVSSRHNPEFTSVEIYQAYADYSDMMSLTEELLRTAAQAVCGKQAISYQGVDIDLSQPFRRVTMNQLVLDATGGGLHVSRLVEC
jgi:lysyl-tRNA synthetase class II